MRIGYGYKRRESDFRAAGVEKVFIDHDRSRLERTDLLTVGLRPGDTLVLLAQGDLGAGGEVPALRKMIADLPAQVEVCEPDKPPSLPPGRKAKFVPGDQDDDCRVIWHDTRYSGAYALESIRRKTGYPGTDKQLRNALTYRYGARSADNI